MDDMCKWCGGRGTIKDYNDGLYHERCIKVKLNVAAVKDQANKVQRPDPDITAFDREYRQRVVGVPHTRQYKNSGKSYVEYLSEGRNQDVKFIEKYK